MIFFCIKLVFRRNGEFSSQHIHDSQAMRDRGIHCVMDQDREERKREQKIEIKTKNEKKQDF